MESRTQEFLEKAEEGISSRNYEKFLMAIASAETAIDNLDELAEIHFIKAVGFFRFRRYNNALEIIDNVIGSMRDVNKTFKLLKFKALILAYKGDYKDSLRLFKELLTHSYENSLLTEVYINIAWVMLWEYKKEPDESVLDEIKIYLDSAYELAEEINDIEKKKLIFSNYAEYFKLQKDYDMAIEMLEKVVPLCSDSWLCETYHDLAQLYMEQGNDDLMEKYLHDAELLASKYDNDLVIAKVLYTGAIAKMKKGDHIRVMDSLCIAFYNFIHCGSYNHAYDCFTKITEVSEALKQECANILKDQFKSMFSNTTYSSLI